MSKPPTSEFKSSVGAVMIRLPAGSFTMGSPESEEGRRLWEQQREVTFANDFYLGKTPVTQEQFEAVTGTNPTDHEKIGDAPSSVRNSVMSPDGKLAATIQDFNLWVKNLETDEEIQLTTTGEKYHGFGTNNQGWTRSDTPILAWSPDSKRIATFRQDEREVGKMTLWRTREGRPEADIWPYALPGDTIVPMLERVILDVETQTKTWLDIEPGHQRTSNCCGLTRGDAWADNEWSDDGQTLAFVSTSRDYKESILYLADAESGEVREVYSERDEIFFESNLTSRGVPNWRVLHESDEFIWFSRKDNWGHLYLHDLSTGNLKNRITEGDWNVIDIVHIDEETRTLWFTAVGREEGVDPYFEHLYRIGLDGSGLTLLTREPYHHSVNLSPDAGYIVSTHSNVETPQVSVLRDADGTILMDLEQADTALLAETGWQAPIPFTAKARDGETDVHGIMILPSHFDPDKTYPIINNIYPGPQTGSVGTRGFSTTRRGQAHAPDVIGLDDTFARAAARQKLFAPYRVAAYEEVPEHQKDSQARWSNNYGGYISIGCDARRVKQCPQTFADLLRPQYRGKVALNGDPTTTGTGFAGVYAAALANKGSFDDIQPGQWADAFQRLEYIALIIFPRHHRVVLQVVRQRDPRIELGADIDAVDVFDERSTGKIDVVEFARELDQDARSRAHVEIEIDLAAIAVPEIAE